MKNLSTLLIALISLPYSSWANDNDSITYETTGQIANIGKEKTYPEQIRDGLLQIGLAFDYGLLKSICKTLFYYFSFPLR